MEKTAFDNRYHGYLNVIENYLNGLFVQENHWTDLYEAMRYSLLSGGKRLRPVMTLEFARLCGLDWHGAVPVGCALELARRHRGEEGRQAEEARQRHHHGPAGHLLPVSLHAGRSRGP